ncbi:MAG TPA: 4Fe-4S binding protein [Polyangia bacterium]
MGHLGHLKEEHRSLLRRLEAGQVGFPEPEAERAWQGMKEILEILFTPEHAALAARMPLLPATLEQLEGRFGVPAAELKPKLDAMCDRGLVFDVVSPRSGTVRYVLAPPVVGFFEMSMMRVPDTLPRKRLAEALEAYCRGDDAFVREVFGHETVLGRALAHETAIDDGLPEVLDWERASAILGDARVRSVTQCYCRHKAEHLGERCSAPMEACLAVDAGADFIIRRGFGRAIGRAESLEILAQARAAGLVQLADNVQHRPTWICNCCGCCCEQLRAISEYGLPAVNPSGFLPRHDDATCKGCSRCARACPTLAITMGARRQTARLKNQLAPVVDEERCIGCGVCADACPQHALRLERRGPQPHVPANTIERVIRMALERGRLGHVFDEGAGRGGRMLNDLFSAMLRLGPVQRALASEQVKSRFVRAALSNVRDPTTQ